MTRERARQLAALACDPSTSEHEQTAAARILAKLVHATPELFAAPPPTAAGAHELDPIVGAAVREAASVAGDLLRDFLAGRTKTKSATGRPCPICGAASTSKQQLGRAVFLACPVGHLWAPKMPGRPKPPKAARPR